MWGNQMAKPPEPSKEAIERARPIVLRALKTDDAEDGEALADFGFTDPPSKSALAQRLRKLGVDINDGPVVVCNTVLDLIKAVARVNG